MCDAPANFSKCLALHLFVPCIYCLPLQDWLQSNHPEDVQEGEKRAKRDKKKKKSTAGNITARSENDEDDDGGGNMTDRSDTSGKGPPTQWRLARHGKIKELEAMLTPENVDDRDGKGNTCLHHACMQVRPAITRLAECPHFDRPFVAPQPSYRLFNA